MRRGVAHVFHGLAAAGFDSPWYWVLHVVVWTVACYRTLGVTHDMLLRARRLPEIAARVEVLAGMAAERAGGIHDAAGPLIAAVAGFGLAGLFVLGFGNGVEAAQAAFLLLMPLGVIAASRQALALRVRRGMGRAELVRALGWRRVLHQGIAVLAMLAAAVVAFILHPPRLPPLP